MVYCGRKSGHSDAEKTTQLLILVGEEGLEPPRPKASVSKTGVSAIFTTLPHLFRGLATIILVPQEGFEPSSPNGRVGYSHLVSPITALRHMWWGRGESNPPSTE